MGKTTTPKPTATLKMQLVSDTGLSATDGITSNGALLVTPAASGDTLSYRLSKDGGATWRAWSATTGPIPSPATDGTWLVQVQEKSGTKVKATASLTFTLDTAAAAPGLTLINDTGNAHDGITQNGSLAVTGVEAGAKLQYSHDGGASWQASFSATEGTNTVLVRQVDVAGNVSQASSLQFTLDTTAPIATNDTAGTTQDTPVVIDLLANDADANGVTLASVGNASHGTVAVNADGTVTYTPDAGYTGSDSFSYSVLDAAGLAANAVAQVTVGAGAVVVTPPPGGPSPFTALDAATTGANVLTEALLASQSHIAIDQASIAWHASGTSSTNLYDGSLSPLGIGAGVLLTSGTTPGTENTVAWFGTDNTDPNNPNGFDNGDPTLDAVVNTVFQTVSYDATTLTFDFTVTDPNATSVSFDVVFGSDEFPEWVDQFVDIAVVMVNGADVALFNHDAMAPLSVIGSNLAGGYFMDNGDGHLPIEYDGVSAVLKIVAPVHAGTNTLKIGIADTGDHVYDSGVFIANLAAGNLPGTGMLIVQPGSTGGAGDDLIDLSGNTAGDTASGGAGDDLVLGGGGNDIISGGTGSDQLSGGGGANEFDYSVLEDWGGDGLDTITDFSGNTFALNNASNTDALNGDVLLFSWSMLASLPNAQMSGFTHPGATLFSTLSAGDLSALTNGQADEAHAQFVYDATTGIVGFDADGTGAAAAMDVTLIGTHPAGLSLTSFIIEG
jgi:hypothetical protein